MPSNRYILGTDIIETIKQYSIVKYYDAGGIVFYENEQSDGFYIIIDGLAKGGIFSSSKVKIFHYFFPGMMVGEVSFIENIPFSLTVQFSTKGSALYIPKTQIQLLKEILDFEQLILFSIIGKVRYLQNSIKKIASANINIKVAQFLIEHQYWLENITINEMSSILNIKRESVSRATSNFISQKLIIKHKNKIKILDFAGLKSLSEM